MARRCATSPSRCKGTIVNAIVSVTRDWGIGHRGHLLVRNKADMRFFRETTMGGTVLCGRTTFQTFPGGALKGRRNVVLTRDEGFAAPGVEVVHGIEDALAAVAVDDPERVWLIGGQSVYAALIDACERAYVTKNDVLVPADAFFPNLDQSPSWELEQTLGEDTTPEGVAFEFCVYRHRQDKLCEA